MCKSETFLRYALLSTLIISPLGAEITQALLTSVQSNAAVRLLYRNAPFACEPFGVVPLEKMAASAPDPQACRERIRRWYRSHPGERHFASMHLRLQQTYRFERIRGGCVLYANGPESYSEMLLLRGLAVIDPSFDNKEWNAKLQRAQKGAQMNKRGLYDSEILKYCIKEED